MRRLPRRSRFAARPSFANGGSSIAPLPTAWTKLETACSPSRACHQANGAASAQRMRSNACTKSSNAGSKPKPYCRRPTPPRCCSGRCSPRDRSTCARSMVGRRSLQNPSISRLTSPPETIPSCYPGIRHTEFQPHSGRDACQCSKPHVKAGGHRMSDDQERSLRLAAKANRERLAVAHREVVMQEEAKKVVDIRQNMARLKELRLVKEAQEARTEI